nr:hypothetical protein [uncultured Desulfobacter sp.]
MKTKLFMFVSIIMVAVVTVFPEICAADEINRQSLCASKLTQIKGVSKSLLQANRSVQEDEEISSLRKEIKTAHNLLQSLMITEGTENRIQLAKTANDSQDTDTWIQDNADKIKRVRQAFANLKNNSRPISSDQKSRLKDTRRQLSDNVIFRLESLPDELEESLLLSPDERIESLKHLALDLELNSQPEIIPPKDRAESPTMITRTSHRPLGNK